MHLRLTILPVAVLLAVAAGCYTGSAVDTNRPPRESVSSADGTEPTAADHDGGVVAAAASGLPCDVAELLVSACADCHGSPPSGGAPNRLLTYEDLVAPSEADPDKSVAEVALLRMKSARRPMPPAGRLDTDRIAVLEGWIDAGLPRGECLAPATADADPGAIAKDAGAEDAALPVSTCTSGVVAEETDPPSPLMKPGKACIACHSETGGSAFEIAGTVYPSLHERDDCHGMSGVKVLLIDATGNTHTMTTNAAGNFIRYTSFPRPYRALVIRGNRVREMKTPQTDGDCNGCHTERGESGAPGRIMAP